MDEQQQEEECCLLAWNRKVLTTQKLDRSEEFSLTLLERNSGPDESQTPSTSDASVTRERAEWGSPRIHSMVSFFSILEEFTDISLLFLFISPGSWELSRFTGQHKRELGLHWVTRIWYTATITSCIIQPWLWDWLFLSLTLAMFDPLFMMGQLLYIGETERKRIFFGYCATVWAVWRNLLFSPNYRVRIEGLLVLAEGHLFTFIVFWHRRKIIKQ